MRNKLRNLLALAAVSSTCLFSGCDAKVKNEARPPQTDMAGLVTQTYNLGYAKGVIDGMTLFSGLYISNGYVQLPNFNTRWMDIPDNLESTNRISIR